MLLGESEPQARACDYHDEPPFEVEAGGQALRFLPAGEDRRQALLDLTQSARESLKVVFYIFAEDDVSRAFRDAMIAAARRGVEVKLILDRFGASVSDPFLEPLVEAGAHCHFFSRKRTQRYLIRNHQKFVVADDRKAIFGGFNVEDSYFAPPEENGWNDLGIEIEGSAVEGLVEWFDRLHEWVDKGNVSARSVLRTIRHWTWRDGPVQWLVGGPSTRLSSWARCVSDDLIRGERLDMFMAYFSPPRGLLRRIGRISDKGETRLLMAGKSDNNATLGATRALYSYLLRRKAKIWEFSPCKLHTKLIVLDDAVYLGSANFDMRSLYINLEIVLRIEDAAFADAMRDFVTRHIAYSEAITPAEHRKRATLWNRLRWNMGWVLVSVLDYNVTRKLNLGL